MSIFDRLKGAIKGSKTAKSPSKSSAQFARSSASAAGGTANGHWTQYEIRLEEAQLGLQIEPTPGDGRPRIIGLVAGGVAQRMGMCVGDIFTAIEGNQIATSEDFVEAMKVLPRPMTITLYRYVPGGAGASSSGSRSTVPALDDTEKEKRREAMVAAALQREKSWDKKVASAKDKRGTQTDHTGRPIYDHSALAAIGTSNPATQRMVALAKQAEKASVEKLGYDPFKPHMSSSSNTGGVGPLAGGVGGGMSLPPPPPSSSSSNGAWPSSPSSSSSSSSSSGSGQGFAAPGVVPPPPNPTAWSSSSLEEDLEQGEQHPDLVTAVNDAMQQLLEKASPEDGDKVQTALVTIDKMLGSLSLALASDQPDNAAVAKMSRVRVMNAAFQTKVASVQGGMALFQAAGFELVEEDPIATITTTSVKAAATGVGSDSSSNGTGLESFLKLPLDGDIRNSTSLVRLRYIVARLKELLL